MDTYKKEEMNYEEWETLKITMSNEIEFIGKNITWKNNS